MTSETSTKVISMKTRSAKALKILTGDGAALATIVILSFASGMLFLVLIGVGVVGPPFPVSRPLCKNAEVQAPRDLQTGATGKKKAKQALLNDAQAHKLPQTNIHFHLGAEHRSDEYNLGADSELFDRGMGQAFPVAPPNVPGQSIPPAHSVRPGWMCPISGYTPAQLSNDYEWKCCLGEMHIGKSYEVHYVHSNAAPGTDMNPVIGDGLAVAAGAARGLLNPQVVVEAMVYTIVNDNDAAYTFDDLVHGWDIAGLDNSSRVMYAGSTTGNSFNNEVCSPFTVSWHVDKKCHAVSAKSFDEMCCEMRDTYGQFADLQPHASRLLLSKEWVVPDDEVLPLA